MSKKKETNIFIIEDNKLFTLALKADIEATFTKTPIRIHSFETGEASMDLFKEVKPEIVILDYHLNSKHPDAADGIKILDWIKNEDEETNVIMLTSDDNIDVAVKSLHHGAADYVVKSETKFKKINYSLRNLIKMREARSEAKLYKRLAIGMFLCIAVLACGIIVVQIFMPALIR